MRLEHTEANLNTPQNQYNSHSVSSTSIQQQQQEKPQQDDQAQQQQAKPQDGQAQPKQPREQEIEKKVKREKEEYSREDSGALTDAFVPYIMPQDVSHPRIFATDSDIVALIADISASSQPASATSAAVSSLAPSTAASAPPPPTNKAALALSGKPPVPARPQPGAPRTADDDTGTRQVMEAGNFSQPAPKQQQQQQQQRSLAAAVLPPPAPRSPKIKEEKNIQALAARPEIQYTARPARSGHTMSSPAGRVAAEPPAPGGGRTQETAVGLSACVGSSSSSGMAAQTEKAGPPPPTGQPPAQAVTGKGVLAAAEAAAPPTSAGFGEVVPEDPDVRDWLIFTNYYDKAYRAQFLMRRRRLAALELERQKLLEEEEFEAAGSMRRHFTAVPMAGSGPGPVAVPGPSPGSVLGYSGGMHYPSPGQASYASPDGGGALPLLQTAARYTAVPNPASSPAAAVYTARVMPAGEARAGAPESSAATNAAHSSQRPPPVPSSSGPAGRAVSGAKRGIDEVSHLSEDQDRNSSSNNKRIAERPWKSMRADTEMPSRSAGAENNGPTAPSRAMGKNKEVDNSNDLTNRSGSSKNGSGRERPQDAPAETSSASTSQPPLRGGNSSSNNINKSSSNQNSGHDNSHNGSGANKTAYQDNAQKQERSHGGSGLAQKQERSHGGPSLAIHKPLRLSDEAPRSRRLPPLDLGKKGDTRFFVVKSFNDANVRHAMGDGLWTTQIKNEQALSEAYKKARHVILFFSVNGSRAFQGYARMASLPTDSAPRPPWMRSIHWDTTRPFYIDWYNTCTTPFSQVHYLINNFNEGLPVTIGKDGQAVEDGCGRRLVREMDGQAYNSSINNNNNNNVSSFPPAQSREDLFPDLRNNRDARDSRDNNMNNMNKNMNNNMNNNSSNRWSPPGFRQGGGGSSRY